MGYESYICGSIEIDRDRWEAFCSENSEVQETWEGKSGNMVCNTLFEDEWEWEGDKLVIGATWRKQNDFEKFLDKVVRLLDEDPTGYFDWHGEDFARSSFYLKKDHWEELEWEKPPPPKWWLEIRNKTKKG